MPLFGIVLAAGKGTRMKSKLYKVMHPVCGIPMVEHVVHVLEELSVERLVTIVGHGAQTVQDHLGERTEYVLQAEQRGTGHAVLQTAHLLESLDGTSVIVCGDTPLLTKETLRQLVDHHHRTQAAATILTAVMSDPSGYGRVIRNEQGTVAGIVEQKDCTPEQALVQEINTGTYCVDNRKLFAALKQVTNHNNSGEFYLTDIIAILRSQGEKVEGSPLQDIEEGTGVNDRLALSEVERVMRQRILKHHLLNGVTIVDPANTYVDAGVVIGADTVLFPGTRLIGNTVIGEDCKIGPNSEIEHAQIGNESEVKQSIITSSVVGEGAQIGPFAYLRPGTVLGRKVKVGDFVEIKNSNIGDGSKIPHLSYVGDSDVGEKVNIGCGVITANYNGLTKNRTTIQDQAFVGSNVTLIAPVTVGQGAYVVAGSTITDSVDDEALAIARERQTNKPGYANVLKSRIRESADKPKRD